MGSLIIPYPKTPQVNDEYMKTLEILSKKIKFIEADSMVKTSKALKDVQPEVERLRQKAVSKVWKLFAGFFFLMFQTIMFIRMLVDRLPVCVACVSSAYVLIWCKTLCILCLMFYCGVKDNVPCIIMFRQLGMCYNNLDRRQGLSGRTECLLWKRVTWYSSFFVQADVVLYEVDGIKNAATVSNTSGE